MYTLNNTFSVTDLRQKTTKILKEIKETGFAYVLNRSKTEAALVDIDYLTALQEAYEDQVDIKEFKKTVGLKRVPFEVHMKKYSKKHSK